MKILRAIWSKLHVYVMWLLASAIFWGWIFSLVSEVPAAERVTLFVYAAECRETELDLELEKSRPEGIRQVRAHLFSYAVFGEDELLHADLYVLPAAEAAKMPDAFRPLPESLAQREGVLALGGTACGLPVGQAAASFVSYPPDADYYLFFGAESVHASDGKAIGVAEAFLLLP